MNICKICGARAISEYCFKHKPNHSLSKGAAIRTKKNKEKALLKKEKIDKMQQFFLLLWKHRKHYSEISNVYLGETPNTMFFHHILLKSNCPEAMYDPENLIFLLPQEHQQVHTDAYRYPEINSRREKLLIKYGII